MTYLPMSEYLGDGRVRTLGGDEIEVSARRVVTSHVEIVVPSMRAPSYAVALGVDCVPPNDLPRIREAQGPLCDRRRGQDRDGRLPVAAAPRRRGAAVDVDQAPRLLDLGPRRDPARSQFAKRVLATSPSQLDVGARGRITSRSVRPAGGQGLPAAYRHQRRPDDVPVRDPVARPNSNALRRIDDVVRMGHVQAIEPGRVTLDGGTLDIDGSALYIDCTADGLGRREPTAVFSGDHISLQTVRTCQPAFSAAVIAHVEATYPDDDTRNAFCNPVPYPHEPTDWLRMMLTFNRNQLQWFSDPDMMAWVDAARLNVLHHVTAAVSERAREKIISVLTSQLPAINDKLETLLAQAEVTD